MESFAAAILSALTAGAANVTSEAVQDIYTSAKNTLLKIVPNFDFDRVEGSDPEELRDELSTRLGGLLEAERAELILEFKKLAEVVDLEDVAKVLGDTVELSDLNSKNDMEIEIDNNERSKFMAKSLQSGGKLTIKKTVRKID